MTGCSSLLAEVIPIPPGRWRRCGNNRAGWACTGAGDHLVTHHAKRNIRKPIVVAQANDADRPPSAPDTPSSPHPPHDHLGDAESGYSPAAGPTVHPRQVLHLVSFPGPWLVSTLRGQRSGTAAQYSNAADQHRPTTPATGRRPAEITTIDCPARSSGRRGRGFKSRHPDKKSQVIGFAP
jgi:hypothetical protein